MHKLLDILRTESQKEIKKKLSKKTVQKLYFYSLVLDLVSNNIYRTQRELYYMAVPLFKSQTVVDKFTKQLFSIEKEFMKYIKASLKGLIYGEVFFYEGNELVIQTTNQISLIPDMTQMTKLVTKYKSCLVIEKESLFNYICNFNTHNILLVTGKGYPCRNTILFLQSISINIFGLFDFDPFGLNIYLNYKKHCNMERIGLFHTDLLSNIDLNKELIELNDYDIRMIHSIEKRAPELIDEVKFLKGLNKKLELEAFVSKNNWFYEKYLKDLQ